MIRSGIHDLIAQVVAVARVAYRLLHRALAVGRAAKPGSWEGGEGLRRAREALLSQALGARIPPEVVPGLDAYELEASIVMRRRAVVGWSPSGTGSLSKMRLDSCATRSRGVC